MSPEGLWINFKTWTCSHFFLFSLTSQKREEVGTLWQINAINGQQKWSCHLTLSWLPSGRACTLQDVFPLRTAAHLKKKGEGVVPEAIIICINPPTRFFHNIFSSHEGSHFLKKKLWEGDEGASTTRLVSKMQFRSQHNRGLAKTCVGPTPWIRTSWLRPGKDYQPFAQSYVPWERVLLRPARFFATPHSGIGSGESSVGSWSCWLIGFSLMRLLWSLFRPGGETLILKWTLIATF